MRRSSPYGRIPLPRRLSVYLDEFSFYSLEDMAEELYGGNLAMTARALITKGLEEWDAREVA